MSISPIHFNWPVLSALLLLLAAPAAIAGNRQWSGPLTGDVSWNTPANWTPPLVPTAGDDVYFPATVNGVAIALDGAQYANTMTLPGGTLTLSGPGALTVMGTIDNSANLTMTAELSGPCVFRQIGDSTFDCRAAMTYTGGTKI